MIKKSTFINKFLYFINLVVAILLLFSYVLPYVSPKVIPLFAVLSLGVPLLILCNVIFLVFWIIRIKRLFALSAIVLLIGYLISSPFYNFSNLNNYLDEDLSIMSYNVRMFNIYNHIKEEGVGEKIVKFINYKKPDILSIQEFDKKYLTKLNFKYHHFIPKSKTGKFGLAIFSNYKITNKGSLGFKNSANNAIYIDIVKNNEYIRIYNVHLQSLGINPEKENFGEKDSKSLIAQLKHGFTKQAEQTELVLNNQHEFIGKKIICGDFNNTAYSYVYKQLLEGKKDAFLQAGEGFGKTFNYFFPMRIDFLLVDKGLTINRFKNFYEQNSDHEPILVRLNTK